MSVSTRMQPRCCQKERRRCCQEERCRSSLMGRRRARMSSHGSATCFHTMWPDNWPPIKISQGPTFERGGGGGWWLNGLIVLGAKFQGSIVSTVWTVRYWSGSVQAVPLHHPRPRAGHDGRTLHRGQPGCRHSCHCRDKRLANGWCH